VLADDIKPGDEFRSQGEVIYTVLDAQPAPPHMRVVVRYRDGGNGVRLYELGKETLVVRPNA
jgi:hypothetical protein